MRDDLAGVTDIMRPYAMLLSAAMLALAVLWAPAARATPAMVAAPSALGAFRSALGQSSHRVVRVLVYGASHTSDDSYTAELRRRLQARFGDGGPGWVMPASPFLYYDHAGVEFGGRGFRGRFVRGAQRERDLYGYAGFALDGRPGAFARVRYAGSLQRVALHYLVEPGAGRLSMRVDGGSERWLDAAGPRRALVHEDVAVTGARHIVELRVRRSRVRVFGLALERRTGVVVDSFGVPGSRVWDQEPWRLEALRGEMRERAPDLIAFAYGTNESASRRVPIADVERRMERMIARWKRIAPRASCLLVGPGDWPRRRRSGEWGTRPRLLDVRRAQAVVARRAGCAFFDTYTFMGGAHSMNRWVTEGLALPDHVHLTRTGSRRLGRALAEALVPGPTP